MTLFGRRSLHFSTSASPKDAEIFNSTRYTGTLYEALEPVVENSRVCTQATTKAAKRDNASKTQTRLHDLDTNFAREANVDDLDLQLLLPKKVREVTFNIVWKEI